MSVDRWVMRFAGTVVLVSLLLAHFVRLLWLTAWSARPNGAGAEQGHA